MSETIADYIASLPDVRGYDLEALEDLCFHDGILRDVGEFPPSEIRDMIQEMRRMTPVIVAALAWRADPTTAPWLTAAIDEYRRQRRAAGIEPPKEAP